LKKRLLRIIAIFVVITLMVTLVAACRNEPDDDRTMPEYVYVPEFITFPGEIEGISGVAATDEAVFFVTEHWDESGRIIQLFSFDLATNEIAELTGYSPYIPYPDAEGWMQASISVDGEGNLWVLEIGSFWRFNVPDDFDGEDWQRFDYQENIGSVNSIRRLDSSGAEISTLRLDSISQGTEWFNIGSFEIGSDGNIYLSAMGDTPIFGNDNSAIFVLDNDANLLFSVPIEGWGELVRMGDGSIAHFGWVSEGEFMGRQALFPIDAATQRFGDEIELPDNMWQIFPGNEDFDLLFMVNADLFGFSIDSEEPEFLLNWIDSDVLAGSFDNISLLPDGRVLTASRQWRGGRMGGTSFFEIVLLTRTHSSELPEREIITLAALWLGGDLQNAIVEFNRNSTTHRIRATDYSQFNNEDDWNAGLTRLSTEIITGIVPDILSVQGLPVRQYAARGILLDLYELIDADPELSRSSFVEGIFEAAEMDGGLFYVFPSFALTTIIGHPSVLGPNPGWNVDEFLSTLSANPNADMPLGPWLTRMNFLMQSIMFGMDQYVDWVTGEVRFDTGEFAALLELAATFPEDIEHSGGGGGAIARPMPMSEMSETELIAQGRQIMTQSGIWDFDAFQRHLISFGGEVVFKGFPTEGRNGHSINAGGGLAITTGASDADAAWSFVRTFLTESFQNELWDLPTNRASFDARAEEAMTTTEWSRVHWIDGVEFEMGPLTQAQIDQVRELIRLTPNVAGFDDILMNIVSEGASDFFGGRGSAQDAARVIQSRVSIYVAEQS